MSKPGPEQFHVVLQLDAAPAIGPLARRLAPLFEVTRHDLAIRLRYCGGWVARSVDGRFADAIEEVLRDVGVAFHRVAAARVSSAPTPVQVTRSIATRGSSVYFESGLTREELPRSQLGFIDLVAFGELPDELAPDRSPPAHNPLLSEARLMVEALPSPWSHQRLLFLDHREHVQPLALLVFGAPRRVLRIERGTTFPGSPLPGGQPWINHFLAFVDGLLADLPESHVVPAAAEFWSGAPLESILLHKPEELERRLSWLELLLELRSEPREASSDELSSDELSSDEASTNEESTSEE